MLQLFIPSMCDTANCCVVCLGCYLTNLLLAKPENGSDHSY